MATVDEQLAKALDDTVEAIKDAVKIEIGGDNVDAMVMKAAEREWHSRYRKTYLDAINKGKKWDDDKDEVLERAREVGKLATHIAVMIAIIEELVRAGVGGPGQGVSIQDTAKPIINADVAKWASGFVDCDPTMAHPTWDWCPKPSGTALEDALGGVFAYFTQKYNVGASVAVIGKVLKP